jgi:uncharacterized Ntn-hydrolase superfamily protein
MACSTAPRPVPLHSATPARRPTTTYSIVARDPATGALGIAVQSHWFSVGPLVAWARPGVGVVATQSFVEPAYGPRGLDLMERGMNAQQALTTLLGADPAGELRQLAFLDARGNTAAHTGEKCIPLAAQKIGPGFSVQANLMKNADVVPRMAQAFTATRGELAQRLLAALEAAEAAGGDLRGRRSAALLVVSGVASGQPWRDRLVDLRVDDHPEPVAELRRLLGLHRAYERMQRGDQALAQNRVKAALEHYAAAAAHAPDDDEVLYWRAVTMAGGGQLAQALPLFQKLFRKDPAWLELTRRLARIGLLTGTGPDGRPAAQHILERAP